MYRRAELSRTVMLVVALSLTAVSTGVCARDCRTVLREVAVEFDGRTATGQGSGTAGELCRAQPFSHRPVAARGADPLAHPVDRGAELRRRRRARGPDLERRQGARLGLGRRPAGAGVRQDPGAAGKRNQPAAEPDPSLHQPAEPRTVRRDPAAARSGARHADHARLDRPDAVGIGRAARTGHRPLPQRLRRIARGAGHHHQDL